MRKEIRIAFKNLPLEQKQKYCNWGKKCGKNVGEKGNFVFRYAPDHFAAMVAQMSDEQIVAVRESSFSKANRYELWKVTK